MPRRFEQQNALFEELPPARAGNPLFCHEDFLEKMNENRSSTVGRRASLLVQRLLVDLRRQYYKSTQGENRGWRRSPLGGSHGFHFYAWWAPKGAQPFKGNPEFEEAPDGAIFLRDIRHHDDHSPLTPQSFGNQYLGIAAPELRRSDLVPAPWTQPQARFADARQKVRIVKGFPGSGKTTALWHAAEVAGKRNILYVTYSSELAALARDHFDKLAPGNKHFHVRTYAQLLRDLLGCDAPFEPVRFSRLAFVKEVSGFSTTILGPWANERGALYDEMHAHLFGATLPIAVGRFAGFPERRVSSRQYRELRERAIGRFAAEAVVEIAETLRRRDPGALEHRFFRELDLAWNAVARIRSRPAGVSPLPGFDEFDCIAIDESQDLTPIESLVIVELAAAIGHDATVLVAGDEAQTVRPTDFEWGWFQDLFHYRLTSPVDFKLQTNLRSPRRIAALVNRVWDLYGAIAKSERPGGSGEAEIDENAGDQVIHCTAKAGEELEELMDAFAGREGLALIAMGEEIPSWVPERLRDSVLTTFEAKGLDFQSVCVLDPGRWLDRILLGRERGRGLELEDLSKRLAIDQLRVALSRPAERLYWLDVNPTDRILSVSGKLLSAGSEEAYPLVPGVLLRSLEEETLDPEDRVRLCENDARQLLAVKPGLAWSRACQAVQLLGPLAGKFSVNDRVARESAHNTLCQVAFTLAFRKLPLPGEVGKVDLYAEAARAARAMSRYDFASLIEAIAGHERDYADDKVHTLIPVAMRLAEQQSKIDPWLLMELQPRSAAWLELLEERVTLNAQVIAELGKLYQLFVPQQAAARVARLREKAIRQHLKKGNYETALQLLQELPEPDPKLVAECHEGLKQFDLAAAEYLRAGRLADALRCYRSIPDFDKSLELVARIGDHPAKASLEWLRKMRDLAAARPQEFSKAMLPTEKKMLEQVLETALGVARKKTAPRKTAPRKTAAKPVKRA